MKTSDLEWLVCHYCHHSPFVATVKSQTGDEILEGTLDCSKCGRRFQIANGSYYLFVPIDPKCLYCEQPIDNETALRQYEIRNAIEGLSGKHWPDAERRLEKSDASIYHCKKERVDVETNRIQATANISYGRRPDPRITRIAVERKISRDAARKWRKRHPELSGNAGVI